MGAYQAKVGGHPGPRDDSSSLGLLGLSHRPRSSGTEARVASPAAWMFQGPCMVVFLKSVWLPWEPRPAWQGLAHMCACMNTRVCGVWMHVSYPELCVSTCALMCQCVRNGCGCWVCPWGWMPTCACPVAEVGGCLVHVPLIGGQGRCIMSTHSRGLLGELSPCWGVWGHLAASA